MQNAPSEDASPPPFRKLLEGGAYLAIIRQLSQMAARTPLDREQLAILASAILASGSARKAAYLLPMLEEALASQPEESLLLLNLGLAKYGTDQAGAVLAFHSFFSLESDEFPESGNFRVLKISPVVEFDRWCETQKPDVLYPAEDVTVTDPDTGATQAYRSRPALAVRIPGAMAIGGWDFPILPTGEVLNGSGFRDVKVWIGAVGQIYDPERHRVVHPWLGKCLDIDEDAVFMMAPENCHFGHWLVDVLPRLRVWDGKGPERPKLAISRALTEHQLETLALFGVLKRDVIWCEIGKRYRFRSLTVVRKDDMYKPSQAMARYLYSRLGPAAATQSKHALGRYLFLERSQTTRGRYIANQDEFYPLLQELGFEWMRRPEISVSQQNALFADAGIVLTVFGTDMISLYQMRPGADLVLLCFDEAMHLGDSSGYLAVASLCAAVGVRLHRVLCTPTSKEGLKSVYRQDIVVDCDALRECLYKIIERRSEEYAGSDRQAT